MTRGVVGIFVLLCAAFLGARAAAAQTSFQAGLDAYQRGDYGAALEQWRPLAEAGEGQAQYRLGAMYAGGLGVPQSLAEAVKTNGLDKYIALQAAQRPAESARADVDAGEALDVGFKWRSHAWDRRRG